MSNNNTPLLVQLLNDARKSLVLAYNTAKNEELKDTSTGIAIALAETSAHLLDLESRT